MRELWHTQSLSNCAALAKCDILITAKPGIHTSVPRLRYVLRQGEEFHRVGPLKETTAPGFISEECDAEVLTSRRALGYETFFLLDFSTTRGSLAQKQETPARAKGQRLKGGFMLNTYYHVNHTIVNYRTHSIAGEVIE